RQVEALKKENSHLRRELEDNSNHLSKLENETSDMKVGTGPAWGEARASKWGGPICPPLTPLSPPPALQMDTPSLYNLKFAPEVMSTGRGAEESPPAPGPHRDGPGELGRATFRMLEELDRE
ncbi:APCL protein, partial [Cisticola juncidis]|nr:APCL protein [Cisticola juncidis]